MDLEFLHCAALKNYVQKNLTDVNGLKEKRIAVIFKETEKSTEEKHYFESLTTSSACINT